MEKAYYLAHINQFDLSMLEQHNYERIYFGNEFCGKLLPDQNNIQQIIELCTKNSLKLTLLTPYVTELEFESLKKIINFIGLNFKQLALIDFEISVNDYGVLDYIASHFPFKLNLGRLLAHQKKDPDLFIFKNNQQEIDPDVLLHVKSTVVDSNPSMLQFISEKFQAIELENTFQGFDVQCNLKIHLFYPMISVAVTRYCLFAAYETRTTNATQPINCCQSCHNQFMQQPLDELTLYLKGNTQFYFNDQLPENMDQVTRLVYYNFT